MKFKNIIFWCEFPKEIDWEKVSKNLKNKKIRTYIAVNSIQEYKEYLKKLSKYKNITIEGAWPTLSFEKGYWFSSFISKESIDKLLEFKDVKIKIDIEPPMPKENNFFRIFNWCIKYFFLKPKNKSYLYKTLLKLNKEKVIISTFPFPEFILKKYGWSNKFKYYNYMHYSTFIPRILKPIYNLYYKSFIKKYGTKNTFYAVGLLDVGIFRNEPAYKNKKEFTKDLEFLYKQGVKNIVIFQLNSIQDKISWFDNLLS